MRLRDVAAQNKIPEDELLRWAANSELNLAVWADGWFAAPATKEINNQYSYGEFRILDEEWLYPKPGYFLDLIAREKIAGSLYRSRPDSPVDRWAKLKNGKPEFTRQDLWVPIEELPRVQEEAKRRAGRYTLEEAARLLESEAGERFDTVLSGLCSATESGELRMHNPAEKFHRDYTAEKTRQVHYFYEEAYWDDLNSWLKAHEPHVRYRFRAPPITAKGSTDLADMDRPEHSETAMPKGPARFNHDPELQARANEAAEKFIQGQGRKPTVQEVAKRLQADHPDLSVSTIERRIRKKW